MTPTALDAALVTAALAAGVAAGCTFVFSNFVMPALGRLPAADAIRAMQAINEKAINPLFLMIFIGTGLAATALSAVHLVAGPPDARTPWLLAGTVVYVVGVVGVTIARNVPLNDALARVVDADRQTPSAWADYDRPWTRWNHLRTVAGVIASALFIVGATR
ncbi:MAG: hypothetical protein CVU56_09060 [Deltaproteobacteria bacterium HGW-Deltaproteobacteria-14]|jgi:uncharacterized membrane protein|nr:MAG: hypothetical protein CVU56_09060 [Deltaproteobacteria bacterium HGW-Deltaproteobacteria-14]